MKTSPDQTSLIAPGSQVEVRDEVWLVRAVQETPADGLMVRVVGTSEFVRDHEATFFTALETIAPLIPEDVEFVADDSPNYRRSRLFLEALLRKTPLPLTEPRLTVAHRQLLDPLEYQQLPVRHALEGVAAPPARRRRRRAGQDARGRHDPLPS